MAGERYYSKLRELLPRELLLNDGRVPLVQAFVGAAAAGMLSGLLLARRPFRLRGAAAWVNGGSRGLGLRIAQELARRGCKLAISARDRENLEHAAHNLLPHAHQVFAQTCDSSQREQVEVFARDAARALGGIDLLVNCASDLEVGALLNMSADDFERAMANDFFSYLYPIAQVLPFMLARRHGAIANISSIGGRVAVPHLLPYSSAKFAVAGLTEGLQSELMGSGVDVIHVVPGLMRTGSPLNVRFKGPSRGEFTWFALADSLPWLSMDAPRAARAVVRAIEERRWRVTLGQPAKLLGKLHDLMPRLTIGALGLANRALLPAADGSGRETLGRELDHQVPLGVLMTPTRRAARRYNQYGRLPTVE